MKALTIIVASFLAPFLVIWIAFIMTACAFNAHNVFTADIFWVLSVVYWIFFSWIPIVYFFDHNK